MKSLVSKSRLFLNVSFIVTLVIGTLSGMYIGYLRSPYSWIRSGRKSIMIDVQFVPHTETADNWWGTISTVESYYLCDGKRVPHGQKMKFSRNSLEIESYIDGEMVRLSTLGGPPIPLDRNGKK